MPAPMKRFTYVYILQSDMDPHRFYTGCANDLRERLRRHNRGDVPHTSKWIPWQIKTYLAFSDNARARQFEHYLKSSPGRAFAKNHL